MIPLIIILILLMVFILLIWFNRPSIKKKTYKTIKAGNINSANVSLIEMRDISKLKFVFEDKKIDPCDYDIFVVCGNSMRIANINDNDIVFVHKLYGADRYKITGTKVLAIEIDKSAEAIQYKDLPIEFKLRKFIAYINGCDSFNKWFEELKNKRKELNDNISFIENKFNDCVQKYKTHNPKCQDFLLILSETLDVKKDKISYSFHPIKFLYGTIEYVVNPNKIPK